MINLNKYNGNKTFFLKIANFNQISIKSRLIDEAFGVRWTIEPVKGIAGRIYASRKNNDDIVVGVGGTRALSSQQRDRKQIFGRRKNKKLGTRRDRPWLKFDSQVLIEHRLS